MVLCYQRQRQITSIYYKLIIKIDIYYKDKKTKKQKDKKTNTSLKALSADPLINDSTQVGDTQMLPPYLLYTDASCWQTGKPGRGPAGMAAIILTPNYKQKIILARDPHSTNCRAETLAVILGVQAIPLHTEFKLFTDSMYVIRLIQGANVIINVDLAKILRNLLQHRTCTTIYVKAHSGIKMNDLADMYAKMALKNSNIIPKEFRLNH